MDLKGLHFGPRRFLREQTEHLTGLRYSAFEHRQLSPILGAEIRGLDLRELDDAAYAELENALTEFKVLFFRDQDWSIEQHLDFASRFGELEEHPFLPAKDDHGEVIRFSKDEQTVGVENQWHSDVSWRGVPSLGSVLRAVEVPPVGGDTLFADMCAAYEGLQPEIKERIEGRTAVHDFTQSFGQAMDEETRRKRQVEFPPAEHPVVRTHPKSGRKILYVNRIFTSHIVGLPREESDALLQQLWTQSDVPEYQCRFRWEKNSVAFWDNRSVQHYAASDYWPQQRVMERVTIIGERPV